MRLEDITAVTPKDSSLLGWEFNGLSSGKQLQTYVRFAVPSKCQEHSVPSDTQLHPRRTEPSLLACLEVPVGGITCDVE